MLLAEQRAQRHDLFVLINLVKSLDNDFRLEKQASEYYAKRDEDNPDEDKEPD